MKAKQLTHKQLTLRTYIHRYLNTYIHTYLPIYLPTYLHTYHHRPSITLILPLPFSLSVLRLSLKKLLACGVIRSYNCIYNLFLPICNWHRLLHDHDRHRLGHRPHPLRKLQLQVESHTKIAIQAARPGVARHIGEGVAVTLPRPSSGHPSDWNIAASFSFQCAPWTLGNYSGSMQTLCFKSSRNNNDSCDPHLDRSL